MNLTGAEKIQNVFKKYPQVKAVYVFGSTASDRKHAESDLDLAVFADEMHVRKHKLAMLADLAREGFCHVDLVFPDDRDMVLLYEAVRQHKIIYQRADFDSGSAYSNIVRKYLDFSRCLDAQRAKYKERIIHGSR